MSGIHITPELVSVNPNQEETFTRAYDAQGGLVETRVVSREGDYASGAWHRVSHDNGRTWGEWETDFNDEEGGRRGRLENSPEGDELLGWDGEPYLDDPVSGCRVGVGSSFYYLNGHDVGYFAMWEKGEDNLRTHAYFVFRRPDGSTVKRMFEFEEGGHDFDPDNLRDPAFLDKNRAMAGDLRILPDGDLCFNLFPTMRLCCRMTGTPLESFFPSCPDLMHGMQVMRAHWDPEKQDYTLTASNVLMLSDLQSGRGIMEPQLAILNSGRWLLVVRGAAIQLPVWHTRTNPGTPAFKWYAYSDDEGKTFTPPMPWHFDTREVVYSPASISAFFRSKKNGKLYWIGNILDDPSLIDSSGSNPRWPLQICQVDETYGFLIKETLTLIDTKREGESFWTELSNFNLLEDRETLDLELRMTKEGMRTIDFDDYNWYTEAWKYTIRFD